MKDFISSLKKLHGSSPKTPQQQIKALERWSKRQQTFLKKEEAKGLASDYLWQDYTLEEKIEVLRNYLLKKK